MSFLFILFPLLRTLSIPIFFRFFWFFTGKKRSFIFTIFENNRQTSCPKHKKARISSERRTKDDRRSIIWPGTCFFSHCIDMGSASSKDSNSKKSGAASVDASHSHWTRLLSPIQRGARAHIAKVFSHPLLSPRFPPFVFKLLFLFGDSTLILPLGLWGRWYYKCTSCSSWTRR